MGGKGEVKFHQKEKEEGILKGWQEQRLGSLEVQVCLRTPGRLHAEVAEMGWDHRPPQGQGRAISSVEVKEGCEKSRT